MRGGVEGRKGRRKGGLTEHVDQVREHIQNVQLHTNTIFPFRHRKEGQSHLLDQEHTSA